MTSRTHPTRAHGIATEQWLAHRLNLHQALADPEGIFAGDTVPAVRKARMREAIARHELATVICARDPATRKPIRYAEAFERVYGEPLDVPSETNSQHTSGVNP